MDLWLIRQQGMSSTELASLYRRFGPLLFSHFLRQLGDENQAMKATRYAFQELITQGKMTEREVVRWIRRLEAPVDVAQTDSLY